MTNKPIKILIVEDTEEHAQLLQHILGASHYPRYSAVCARTLAQAMERLQGGGIDAVLLDLNLALNHFLDSLDMTQNEKPHF